MRKPIRCSRFGKRLSDRSGFRDWRMQGRPHSAYIIGGACMLLVQLLRKPFAYTPLWHWITDGLLALAR